MKNYNCIVIGGGFTGCAAAIAASREGLKVLLLEEGGSLGGAAIHNLVYPFMPYATTVKDENGKEKTHILSRGIFEKLVERLNEYGGLDTEYLKVILDDEVTKAGADVLFHAKLCDVIKEGNHIKAVETATSAGKMQFEADYFIDCTGDGNLLSQAQIPFQLGRKEDNLCQPMTLCFRVANIDKPVFYENKPQMQALYKEWLKAGKFTNPRENILCFNYKPIDGMIHFNTTRIVKMNPVDPFDVTRAEMEARKQVIELLDFFRENKLPGLENAKLVHSAASIGIRESRKMCGEHILTEEELKDCTKFSDAIAAGNYDIDIHSPTGAGTSHYYFPAGTWYTIPYRSLIPKKEDCDNLLAGGRCISCTHEAQASIRIMPICCTTGEAAGVAAAVACKAGKSAVQEADVSSIQKILTENGAYLGI